MGDTGSTPEGLGWRPPLCPEAQGRYWQNLLVLAQTTRESSFKAFLSKPSYVAMVAQIGAVPRRKFPSCLFATLLERAASTKELSSGGEAIELYLGRMATRKCNRLAGFNHCGLSVSGSYCLSCDCYVQLV